MQAQIVNSKTVSGAVGEFRAVSANGLALGQVAQSTAATEAVLGVAQYAWVALDNVRVVTWAPTKPIAGAALTSASAGDYHLMVDANGRFIPWVGGGGPQHAVAIWSPSTAQPTAAVDEQITIIFTGYTGHRA